MLSLTPKQTKQANKLDNDPLESCELRLSEFSRDTVSPPFTWSIP